MKWITFISIQKDDKVVEVRSINPFISVLFFNRRISDLDVIPSCDLAVNDSIFVFIGYSGRTLLEYKMQMILCWSQIR